MTQKDTEAATQIREFLLDLEHEINAANKAFPPAEGESVLADFANATRRVALVGLYSVQSIAHSRFSDYMDQES
jgi:hypothetical protein